ncbi:pseudouridine synthase [Ceraceosorus bombacis]|uniref:tRNA pseudouridine(55) synthase n=1 Tax=Ceraceosorus bombacis TaxID=401625 RepID=A0A0P1BAC7_9BASI|nr:pseudouridine synthase [Ceraceosorus bombacis]
MPPDRQGGGSGSRIASLDDRPLSGIFGINKPSGPLSMVLLDDIKELFAYNRQGGGSGSRIASLDDRPLSGIFGINKPSGPLSMVLLDDIKELFAYSSLFKNPDGSLPAENGGRGWRGGKRKTGLSKAERKKNAPPKIGQGGTLDPLADGVLVVGVGRGTKQLQRFLDCTKEYRSTGLLGTATTSYDCKDPILLRAPFQHVDRETILEALPRFRGDLKQLPPYFSAIKMDGKRLFDYAREGLELPRPIEPRNVRVEQLELVEWHPVGSHAAIKMDGKRLFDYAREGLELPRPIEPRNVRVEQLELVEWHPAGSHAKDVALPGNCIEWHVFEKALKEFEEDTVERDEQGLAEWERILLSRIQPC